MKSSPVHLLQQRGFTLIELLVVIAIIGILSSVVLASMDSAREQAMDAQVLSEMRELERVMEMYHLDHGEYPCRPGSGETSDVITMTSGCRDITPYIDPIPTNPHPEWEDIGYRYHPGMVDNHTEDRSTYTMLFKMQRVTDPNKWCSVSAGPGYDNWTNNYPPCRGSSE